MRRACFLSALMLSSVLGCGSVAAQDCSADTQLTEAAAELLLAHNERPTGQVLVNAVRAVGSDAVGVHALFVPAQETRESERQWLATLRTRVDGELVCGRADSEAGRLVIGLGRGGELAPIDDKARVVRGRLHENFRDAELVIATGDAQLIRVGVSRESLSQGVALAPDLSLPLKVQLVARGPAGPRPVAERELHDRRASAPERSETAAESHLQRAATKAAVVAEHGAEGLSKLLLALRAERGRGGLRMNRLLHQAASQHAQEVCAKGRVAHEVEAGVGPEARLARAGLEARLLGEAIARADGVDSALDALKNSPSHLYTLLDRRFTDIGIGVAQDSAQKYCYVVLLCAWPRYIGKAAR
jgi:uncharacterized protein YkwD